MKIIYVLNSGSFGGMEKHVQYLVEGMVDKGHEVFVWCPAGDIVKGLKEVGAKVTLEKIRLDIDPVYICKLKKFLKQNKIDIVHAHELKAVTNAILAAWLVGVRYKISHTHTPISEWQINPIKKRINLFFYSKIVNWFSTHEIALTESRKRIKIAEGIKEDKLFIVESPNAVKIDEFLINEDVGKKYREKILARHNLREDAVVWGCLGRLTEEKGHHILIEAFKLFLEGLPKEEKDKQHLELVGGGRLEDLYKRKIKELKIENQVTITGRFSDEDKIKYYSSFDFFIHPSLAEGFGLVLIEAMIVGIPTIASDLEVFKEVAKDTVTYFKKGDAEDLSKVMLKVYQDGHSVQEKKQKAQRRATNLYSFEKFTECYNQYYLDLLSK